MKTKLLTKEELRSICGGKATNPAATQGFLCRVVDEDGTEHVIHAQTVEECLEFAGMH